jgi:hypothetical protein
VDWVAHSRTSSPSFRTAHLPAGPPARVGRWFRERSRVSSDSWRPRRMVVDQNEAPRPANTGGRGCSLMDPVPVQTAASGPPELVSLTAIRISPRVPGAVFARRGIGVSHFGHAHRYRSRSRGGRLTVHLGVERLVALPALRVEQNEHDRTLTRTGPPAAAGVPAAGYAARGTATKGQHGNPR